MFGRAHYGANEGLKRRTSLSARGGDIHLWSAPTRSCRGPFIFARSVLPSSTSSIVSAVVQRATFVERGFARRVGDDRDAHTAPASP